MPKELAMKNTTLFAKEVMPHMRRYGLNMRPAGGPRNCPTRFKTLSATPQRSGLAQEQISTQDSHPRKNTSAGGTNISYVDTDPGIP
ncbi:MAG: hypothetical protein CM1200mP27_05570 [Chloroflexota bacterium]|nr:MAG: hypothetical protein CM1200mP27_05570 [Chloroflexota bacterium]